MNIKSIVRDALVGKKLKFTNVHRREVVLMIEDVTIDHHSRDLEPATQANDWWPATSESYTINIHLADGSKTEISFDKELVIVD